MEYYQAEQGASIRFGFSMPDDGSALQEALEAAKGADAVVLTLGITPGLEGEEMNVDAAGFKGGDRTAIELPKPQRELLAAVRRLGKPTVVVLTGGSALAFDPGQASAVLDSWYSGGRGGGRGGGGALRGLQPGGAVARDGSTRSDEGPAAFPELRDGGADVPLLRGQAPLPVRSRGFRTPRSSTASRRCARWGSYRATLGRSGSR